MEFRLSYLKTKTMMLWKSCTQHTSKFGKFSSGHRTEKGQFSLQSQRRAMPENVQTTRQLNSLCQQIWKTQQWPQDWKRSAFIPVPRNVQTTAQLHSHTSKVMLKILQARLQQYVNHELPDVQAGFRKGRGIIDQIVNICWIIKKESSRKTAISALLTMPKPLCGSQ